MKRRILFLAVLFILGTTVSFAQIRDIPQAVKDSFAAKYAGAEDATYVDNIVSVQVKFAQNGEKQMAKYSNKGQWIETEKDYDFEKLSTEVKDGFSKSKYSTDEWKVVDTKIISRPGKKDLYRIKVEKSGIQKKHLFFNETGRLVSESITL